MEAVLTCTHHLYFEKIRKQITFFHLKINIFTAVKNHSILHRPVIVMHFQTFSKATWSGSTDCHMKPLLEPPWVGQARFVGAQVK